jgi:hypothetical protein
MRDRGMADHTARFVWLHITTGSASPDNGATSETNRIVKCERMR